MVITRPNHDLTTNYLYYWSEEIISYAQKSGVKIVDLQGKRASEKEFRGVLLKTKPTFVMLNGHGAEDRVTGFGNEVLVSLTKNQDLLKDKVVFSRSCRSASKLGQSCVNGSKGAYIGYDEDFVFMYDPSKITHPLTDATAGMYLRASNQVAISLLKGHNAEESHKRGKDGFKREIGKLVASNSKDSEALSWLVWDYLHQVCLGNTNFSIS